LRCLPGEHWRKFLQWEKNKQGELEVLPKRALDSYILGIVFGGIRTSGLEVLPKGALRVLPMQSSDVKGSTQVLSKIAVAVPSKGALKVPPKIAIENFSGRRKGQGALEHSKCCPMPINAVARVLYFSLYKIRIIQSPDRGLTRSSDLESSVYACNK